jgi:hypothetical protein
MTIKSEKKRDCCCSGHPAGRPKLSRGVCFGDCLRPAVRERIQGRRIERAWSAATDLEDVED